MILPSPLALMRHEARNDAFEWNALALDNNTGRLVYRGTTSDANGAATGSSRSRTTADRTERI